MRPFAFGLLLALLFLSTTSATADTLRLKNGRVYEGKLISRDASKVVFRVEKAGITSTQEFKTEDVASIEEGPAAPAPSPEKKENAEAQPSEITKRTGKGEPYYVLPIRGTIGLEVSCKVVDECFRSAKQIGAKVVVLEIESPGGAVSELKQLLTLLDRYGDLRTVAYVKEAKSAAAVLAMACHEIVMADRAQIGAATPYKLAPDGTPQNISEKFESSVRADFRSATERGGHDPLLMEGMVRDDIVLSLKRAGNGKFRVVEGAGEKPLKRNGEILCLTTQQAIECGLALGSAEKLADCRRALGIAEWFDVTDDGRARVARWNQEIQTAVEGFRKAWHNADGALVEAQAAAAAKKRTDFTNALRRAESNLRRMEELAQKYPGLGDDDSLKMARDRIKAVRKAIER